MTGMENATAVREAHRFDEDKLVAYLRTSLNADLELEKVSQFMGGQSNPTYLLQFKDATYVMRKKPPGKLLPSAHMVEREYRVMAALAGSAVPVPTMRVLCEDPEIIGTAFYVMDFVEGRVYADPLLPELTNADRGQAYQHLAEVMAAMHEVDPGDAGLGDFGKPSGYTERQFSVWTRQYEASKTEDLGEMDELHAWLKNNLPQSEETTIIHGDYRLGNVMLDPVQPRIVAVLDWELSTLGNPLVDLAHCCLSYCIPAGAGEYPGLVGADLDGLQIPDEAGFLDSYFSARGIDAPDNWAFYMAFALYRMAAICQGVYYRGIQGNASDPKAKEYGQITRYLAKIGVQRIKG